MKAFELKGLTECSLPVFFSFFPMSVCQFCYFFVFKYMYNILHEQHHLNCGLESHFWSWYAMVVDHIPTYITMENYGNNTMD